tara:strand:- start:451 stop:801 length:351 start_codon:yes stop_codon:yes gene_type:complete
MFNLNLDFKYVGALLRSPFGVALSCFIVALILVSIGVSLGSSSKEDVCKEELILIKLQEKQIKDIEIELTKSISDGETSCIEREERICRQEKESIKQNCNDLIESILPGSGASLDD